MATSKEKQRIFDLTLQVNDLREELDGARTQNKELTAERSRTIRARFKDQEENSSLRQTLAAQTAENNQLRSLIETSQEQIHQRAQQSDGALAAALNTEEALLQARVQLASTQAERDAQKLSLQETLLTVRELTEQNQRLRTAEQERDALARQTKSLVSERNLLRSQLGNYLVGLGKTPLRTYILNCLGATPLIGRVFRNGSERLYSDNHKKPSIKNR